MLPKRRFIFDLEVGGPYQDVIDKLESAPVYRDLIVEAVRQYRGEEQMDKKVQIALLQKALTSTMRELNDAVEAFLYREASILAQQVVDLTKWLEDITISF